MLSNCAWAAGAGLPWQAVYVCTGWCKSLLCSAAASAVKFNADMHHKVQSRSLASMQILIELKLPDKTWNV